MKTHLRMLAAIAASLLVVGSQGQASVVTYQIRDLGDSPELVSKNIAAVHPGTGFVSVAKFDYGGRGQLNRFVRALGLSAGVVPIATLMEVDISDLRGKSINSAVLTFDVNQGARGTSQVTVNSFDANGQLGFMWNPPSLGTVVADVSKVPKNRIDVTELLRARVNSGEDWLGLQLRAASGNLMSFTTGRGLDSDSAQVRLTVDYSDATISHNPEPSTLAIWSILGVGLVVARRRLAG